MSSRRWFFVSVVVAGLLFTACAGVPAPPATQSEPAQPTEQPTQAEVVAPTESVTEAPTAAPTEAPTATPSSSSSTKLFDVGAIFPEGPGREEVFNNCLNCHNIAPIVTLRKTAEDWQRTDREHREMRVPTLDEEDNELIYAYLSEHFDENAPVPELPQILIDAWTSY